MNIVLCHVFMQQWSCQTSKDMETRQPSCSASSVSYVIESNDERKRPDENACTKDGSLDRHGKPATKGRTGGWRCAMFILVNQGLATLAFAAVEVNLVLFSKSVLRHTNAEAADTFSRWMGTVYLFSFMGAFLSDSYLGRYLTCVTFQVLYLIGLVALSLVTQLFLLKPQGCGKLGQLCEPHSPAEIAIFYVAIYLIALGNGAPEPALAAFGADQFDEEDDEEKQSKNSFYSYFYVALNLGSLVAETVLVYVQNTGNWILGFWICATCAMVAFSLLLCGTFRYRHFKTVGNPISKFCQVIVASMRKINLQVPSDVEGLYEVQRKEDKNNGVRRILHTDGFKFLDRAAIITPQDIFLLTNKGETANPWYLCTITQVEEVKCILRLLPIWLCSILSSVVFVQMLSLFVEQGAAMDTTISNFHIPPASMFAFDIVSTSAFILLYDKLMVPLYVRLTKREPKPPSGLQRIGIGIAIAMVSMIIAGTVEQQRLKYANHNGEETSALSIFWQTPQYVLVGVSEALIYVAQMEFFASQTPDGLKSLGIGLSMYSSAMGSYICSIILAAVMAITSKNGKPGWVPPDLNAGHLDRYFFLLAALAALNLALFVACAKRYNPVSFEKRAEGVEMEARHQASEA
ncbi:PREDICTED: protein NRT1/ PTR FAMILY 7.2 isoform X1 [Theobroma cacao]|uniref:Protein NRT1/ PTR FAMILY 7.2 isoform X1 n=1 Tax=Theobroma cacao TaxID=3641 RepID=A0AB32W1C1_THECC|nr:PREDICTED: protein NRT1/ PTR FAMILY 7.2 isoform X1 [Theobroma cacao]